MMYLYYKGTYLNSLTDNDYSLLDTIGGKMECIKELIHYYENGNIKDCDNLDKKNLYDIFYFICLEERNNGFNPRRGQVSKAIMKDIEGGRISLAEGLKLYKDNLAYI